MENLSNNPTKLDLYGKKIGDVGAQALATALQVNHSLTRLDTLIYLWIFH